jgi:hypothetical protein
MNKIQITDLPLKVRQYCIKPETALIFTYSQNHHILLFSGILSMAWCPRDADLLLSCGKVTTPSSHKSKVK